MWSTRRIAPGLRARLERERGVELVNPQDNGFCPKSNRAGNCLAAELAPLAALASISGSADSSVVELELAYPADHGSVQAARTRSVRLTIVKRDGQVVVSEFFGSS